MFDSPAFYRSRLAILPGAACGWLRFGITAVPKHAPPTLSR
jgi:hypothetical protein